MDHEGKVIRDKQHLQRIRSLVIPPAWERVWICALPHGHLQAVGYDAKGRKQYRYHPLYSQFRNHTKFSRIPDFAKVLPKIREHIRLDMAKPGLPREKVLATVVKLLETTCIRVGNIEYAKENESFGLTTMQDRHVEIKGATIKFQFRGKSKQDHEMEFHDKRLARIVQACQDLPGEELFQYLDEQGNQHCIDSTDVNQYLHEITGQHITAKDFRTWAGTVQAAMELAEIGPAQSATEAKRNIVTAIKHSASRLGNRPATCRKYYVHPMMLEAYEDGMLFQFLKPGISEENREGLLPEEAAILRLIRKRTSISLPGAA